MKYFRICIALICCCIFTQCSFSQIYKTVVYDSYNNFNKFSYSLFLPQGYKYTRREEIHSDVDRYIYPDRSVVRITDMSGGFISEMKTKKYGRGIYMDMLSREMTIEGLDNDSLYWKERRFGNAYISYYNVTKSNKARYDSIINNNTVS